MTTAQIRDVEFDAVQCEKQLRGGKWNAFRGASQASVALGPWVPTADERLAGIDFLSEDVTLDVFKPIFRPTASQLDWVESYLGARSTEDPRSSSASFWHRGPFRTSHQNSHIFGMRRE